MPVIWKAPDNVLNLLNAIKAKHHPHLEQAGFAIVFSESKPFIKNRFNWGTAAKFSAFNKLFQTPLKKDFCLIICSDVWHIILNNHQREALLDLHLSRCDVEYEPETIIDGKNKKIVKDDWGRVKYTSDIKYDDDGNPKWFVAPLDLMVFSKNVERYGLWCQELNELQSVMSAIGGDNEK